MRRNGHHSNGGRKTLASSSTPKPRRILLRCAPATFTLILLVYCWVLCYPYRRLLFSANQHPTGRCAINLYGLPRAFKSLVLPSLVKNVIQVNAQYGCDYFVHYYDQTKEPPGRSGSGGVIKPEEILLLKEQVELAARQFAPRGGGGEEDGEGSRMPTVAFVKDREEDFWAEYQPLIDKIRNQKGPDGEYFYYPWKAMTYQYPYTTDNIIKMWHTIQRSWDLMEDTARKEGFGEYARVAMLRSDVVYVTPIDVYDVGEATKDFDNKVAVIPGFSKHPVSDRLVYGPARAVKIWAAERFRRMDRHALWISEHNPGWGLHSERFVMYSIFEPIKKLGIELREHPTLCFFRARADETVWTSDCGGEDQVSRPTIMANLGPDPKAVVERIIGRRCGTSVKLKHPRVDSLNCSVAVSEGSTIEVV